MGGIPRSFTEETLKKSLKRIAKIEHMEFFPPADGKRTGFGFVTFCDEASRDKVMLRGKIKVGKRNWVYFHHCRKNDGVVTPGMRLRKRNVGQAVVLKEKREGGRVVVIGNCHLHWCPLLPELKLLQMNQVLRKVVECRYVFGALCFFFICYFDLFI